MPDHFFAPLIAAIRARWSAASLAAQFAAAAAAVIGVSMALFGWWVAGRIERSVIDHAATSASLHMDIFIEPHLQDLAHNNELSANSKKALSELISKTNRDQKLVDIRVWGKYGTPVYSAAAEPSLAAASGISTSLPASTVKMIGTAWDGTIQSAYEDAGSSIAARAGINPRDAVLKVYAPMHETGTTRVIAVAELDATSPGLASGLRRALLQTAGIVGLLSLAMLASLSSIVRRGSQLISDQRLALQSRVNELTALLETNAGLRADIIDTNRRATDRNDKALRRIGAELHDGPVQLIALSLLRLEALKLPELGGVERRNSDNLDAVEQALRDALKEIRDLCSGLALPSLEGISVSKMINYAIMNHERRTRTRVTREGGGDLNIPAAPLVLMCIYRFVQEGLNNAVKHGGGKDQRVIAQFDGKKLELTVADGGPGLNGEWHDPERFASGHCLGLAGLKDRIETLGGSFAISSIPEQGTQLSATLDMTALAAAAPLNSGSLNSGALNLGALNSGPIT
jgi:signal transduction histidine kinase